MRMTEEIGALMTALAKAQGAMEDAEKDAANPHLKSRYANLAAVRRAVRKPLSDHGIAYVQLPRTGEGFVEVETLLAFESQYISDVLRMPVLQNTPQGVGSAITYAKRYALMGMLGLAASDEDDDGHVASTNGNGYVKHDTLSTRATLANAKPTPKPALTAVKDDPAAALRAKARGIAKEGSKAFNNWYHMLSDTEADHVDAIAEELVEIGKAVDEAETLRAG